MLHDPLSYFFELLHARVWSLCLGGRAEFWPVLPADLAPCLGHQLFSEFWSVLGEGVIRHFNKNQYKSDLIWFCQNWDKNVSNKDTSHIRKIAWLRYKINIISIENVLQKQGIIKLNAAKKSPHSNSCMIAWLLPLAMFQFPTSTEYLRLQSEQVKRIILTLCQLNISQWWWWEEEGTEVPQLFKSFLTACGQTVYTFCATKISFTWLFNYSGYIH